MITHVRTGYLDDGQGDPAFPDRLQRALETAFPGATVEIVSQEGTGSRPHGLQPFAVSDVHGSDGVIEATEAEEHIADIEYAAGF